jgi:heme O synthase-like polyprenyltransferase
MRKAAGAVAAAFAMGTGAMTLMGMAFAVHVEAAVLGVVGLALYASSSLLNGKASAETTGGVAKQA